jgi:hypothetical protein
MRDLTKEGNYSIHMHRYKLPRAGHLSFSQGCNTLSKPQRSDIGCPPNFIHILLPPHQDRFPDLCYKHDGLGICPGGAEGQCEFKTRIRFRKGGARLGKGRELTEERTSF